MTQIKLKQNDITNLKVDVIVNAANPSLTNGGGVNGAIHSAAGPNLDRECKQIREEKYPNGLPTGEAVITQGYKLDADYVIHTVGPVYSESKDRDHLLKNSFRNSLQLAEEKDLKSIAFPAISSGAYGYPTERVAVVAKNVVDSFEFGSIEKVIFCLYSKNDYQTWKKVF